MSAITNAFAVPPPPPVERMYVFVFDLLHPTLRIDALATFIQHTRQVSSWSYVMPGCYFLRSHETAVALQVAFSTMTNGARILVSEVNLATMSGNLPNAAWEWVFGMPPGSIERNALLPKP